MRLAVLLALEGLAILSMSQIHRQVFDPAWWNALARASGLAHLGLRNVVALALVSTAIALYAGRLPRAVGAGGVGGGDTPPAHTPHQRAGFIAAHMLAFGAFAAATTAVAGGASAPLLLAFWALSGMAALQLMFLAAAPRVVAGFDAKRVAASLAPFAALALAGLATRSLTVALWPDLARVTLELVEGALSIVYDDVGSAASAYFLKLDDFRVLVLASCSGIEGMGVAGAFSALYLWFARDRLVFPRSVLLVPLAIVASYAINIVRLVILMIIGAKLSPELALRFFHSFAGWIFFLGSSWALVAWSSRSRFFAKPRANVKLEPSPSAPYLVPLIAALLAATVASADAMGTFEWLYPLRIVAAGGVLVVLRARLPSFAWGASAIGGGVAVGVAWILLLLAQAPRSPADLAPLWQSSASFVALWIACRVVGALVIAPLVEELAFRGFLLRRLQAAQFELVDYRTVSAMAVVVSSLLFGLLHQNVLGGVLAGVVFAVLVRRSGRIGDAVVAHAAANLVVGAYALAIGDPGALS